MLCNGPDTLLKVALLVEISAPQPIHGSLGSSESAFQSKRHLDRFSRFCTSHRRVSLYFAMGRPFHLKIGPSQGRIYTVSQKRSHFERSVTLSSLNRFSKFLHCWKVYEICYNILKTIPTLTEACCYTTLEN